MRLITRRALSSSPKMRPADAARCHIFNSFFFEKLTNANTAGWCSLTL